MRGIKFFCEKDLQLNLLQVVGLWGDRANGGGIFINKVVESGKMWFKFQYIWIIIYSGGKSHWDI